MKKPEAKNLVTLPLKLYLVKGTALLGKNYKTNWREKRRGKSTL